MTSPPLHEVLQFLAPLSAARADELAGWLADGLQRGGTVADAGCGWCELLLRVAAAAPLSRAVGVDLAQDLLAEGERRAAARALGDRVSLITGDAAEHLPAQVEALIAIGASQIWGPPVEEAQPLDYAAALGSMRSRLPRGGRVVYGEGIWSQPPTPEATAPLSGRADEFLELPVLLDLVRDMGFEVDHVARATLQEWDDFEAGFSATLSPERAAGQRTAYHQGYRGVLGFAHLCLRAA